jgi:hypothetical protein
MKKIHLVFTIVLLVFISSCSKENTGRVKVRFTNKSTQEINNIKVQDRYVGHLNVGETSRWVLFEKYSFDSGHSAEKISLSQANSQIDFIYSSFCGTEFKTVEDGSYDVGLQVFVNTNGKPYLQIN